MTVNQKIIVEKLLNGFSIAGFRLRDGEHNVISRIHTRTFYWLKQNYLRKTKEGLYVIDKRKVRQQHGNSFIKRTYKKSKKEQSNNGQKS